MNPDVLASLTRVERMHVNLVLSTVRSQAADRAVKRVQCAGISPTLERLFGPGRTLLGVENLPVFDVRESYVCVANHRTFFDLYAVASYLQTRAKMRQRIWFPVRAPFFYDNPAGMLVNAAASAFAMYPPVFRDRRRAHLNDAVLDETIRLLRAGGSFIGLHPEGQRNKSADSLDLLPARWGVGRVLAESQAWVIPTWIDGLASGAEEQLRRRVRGASGLTMVFGEPYKAQVLGAGASRAEYTEVSAEALARVRALGASLRR